MKCLLCGRELSNPQSRELGYGPVCYKRRFGITPHFCPRDGNSSINAALDYELPGQMSMEDYLQMVSEQ